MIFRSSVLRALLSSGQMRPRLNLTILAHAILGKAPCGHMQRKFFGYYQLTRTRKLSNLKEMSTRSYQDAVVHLNSLQSNAETLNALRASGGRSDLAIPEMLEYLERIGYMPQQLNALNVIHITGTKGKGSTSAFTDSILRSAMPKWKIGLYTSPHLVAVRERIRINGAPLPEDEFAKYFFEVWDKLVANNPRKIPTTPGMPGYFRFLTLMAFHVFLDKKVDATILEVGIGGTYDSTNIVPGPIVTGIASLGIDHIIVLGNTIQDIAWQKSGIFKGNVPAFTSIQPEEAMPVLEARAIELKAKDLTIVSITPELRELKLGLAGVHQVQNAALAVRLAKSFLQSQTGSLFEESDLPESFKRGLATTKWSGRCQTVLDPTRKDVTWYLDGAHTIESIECCMQWFVSPGVGLVSIPVVDEKYKHSLRALIFNCTGRSGATFLAVIKKSIVSLGGSAFFDHVIFCTNVTYANGVFKGDLTTKAIPAADLAGLKTQQALSAAWSSLLPDFDPSHIHVLPSIEDAIRELEKISTLSPKPVQVLVTGSLHLVGGVIEVAGLSEVAL